MEGMDKGSMEPEKTGRAMKAIIPAAVLAGLVLLLLGVAYATGSIGNKKKALAGAIENTFTQSLEAMGKAWQLEEYQGMFKDGEYSAEADFRMGGLLQLEMLVNGNTQAYGAKIDLGYFGSSLFYAQLYVDKGELLLGIPYISEYVFRVDRETFEADVENLARQGLLDQETAGYLESLNEGSRKVDFKDEELKQGMLEIAKDVKDIFYSLEVEGCESRELTVDGAVRSCKGYRAALTGEHMAAYILDIKRVYEKNEAFRDYCNELVAAAAGFGSARELLGYYDMVGLLEETASELGEHSPIDIYFYTYKKRLARIYAQPEEGTSFEWNFYGGSFPLENMELAISGHEGEIKLARRGSLSGSAYQAEYEVEDSWEDITVTLEYDKEKGDFRFQGYDGYGGISTFLLEGKLKKSIPGKKLVVSIDSFSLGGEELLAGDIKVTNQCGDFELPEGERLDITKMTQKEWEEFLQEIYGNM
ncbi:hypothetical protein IMSAGC019_00388 [Lachnospiraceae bacterium]|nr:hypothetical protein IMSAGC019_00388 [Lachnospiraceae bacterium]